MLAFAIALSMLLRGRRPVHWLFAAFAAEIALWYGSQSLFGLFQAPIWVRATAVLTVLLPQFAVHLFQAIVPLEVGAPRARLPRIAAWIGAFMLALELSPYHEAPLSLGVAYFYVFGLISAALISLARRGRRSKSRAVRDRVRFLVVVGAAATTFTLADFLSFLGVVLPPIGAVLAIVFLFVLAESLTRPRLADLYEMAGRSLVSTALAFSFAGIFYVFVTYVGRFNTMYLNGVLAAIVFLVLFEPLQAEVERRIHQFFFRERFDLETSVADLRRRLSHVLERQEMVDVLLSGLERSRRVTSAAIYLRDQDGNGFDLAGSIGGITTNDKEPSPLFGRIPTRLETLAVRPLIDRLTQQSSVALEELSREGKDSDAPVLTSASALGVMDSAVLLGVRGDDEECVGIICVADDRVRDAFTPEEIKVLENVAAQIGVAIANSQIYSRMKERDRLAALGAMAAGLAHEVKNPLGAIKGAAQLLDEMSTYGSKEGQEWVGIILEEVNRLDRVVGSFLDYARPHAGNPIPLDLNGAVRRTVQIWSSQQLEDVNISLELADGLPRAKIDPEQFRQVLLNLVQNAVQAMDGRGRVFVSTQRKRVGRPRSWSGSGNDKGPASTEPELVEVSVRDTGPGISQKVLKNLFIPFFTTKDQGTGLGLAISQSIVQNVGGTIEVQSQPGAGTTFTITLPVATDALVTPVPTAAEPTDTSPVSTNARGEPQPAKA